MPGFSDYTENGVLNQIFNGDAFVVPGRFLALFTSANGLEENNITGADEVSATGTGYIRVNVTANGGFTTSTTGTLSNAQEFDFPIATADWTTITHAAIIDTVSNGTGNVLCWGPLVNPRVIYTGDSIRVPAGAFTVTLD